MKLVLNDGKILKDCFASIGNIIDEGILECDSEGVRLRALDRSHISFVELDLKEDLFDDYVCDTPEKINIDTVDLNKIFKRYKNNEVLELETNDSSLTLTFKGDSNRVFSLNFISLDYETPAPPSVDLPVHLEIALDFIKDALKDIEIYSEKVKFVVDEDYIILNGAGEFGEVADKYIHGADVNIVVDSVFSIEKINEMLKDIKFNDYCNIWLGDEKPIIIKIAIDTGFNDDSFIKFMLAPRLETEEE